MHSSEPENPAPIFKTSMEDPDLGRPYDSKPFRYNLWSRTPHKPSLEKIFKLYFVSKVSILLAFILLVFALKNPVILALIAPISLIFVIMVIKSLIEDHGEITVTAICVNMILVILPLVLAYYLAYLGIAMNTADVCALIDQSQCERKSINVFRDLF